MSNFIIEAENVSKRYQLGQFNAQSLREEAEHLLQQIRRKLGAANAAHVANSRSEFWALKEISFSVEPGEVLGIIGRNGAGKSTLLKILSRVTRPTSGQIRLRGRVASLLEVGTGFHPELTGRENIYLNGAILGMTKTEVKSKFDEIVAFADLEKFLDTPVKRYSSGMWVRLAFAVAAHLEPEILIIDEVLAVGDYTFQRKCLNKMQEVSRAGGRTVLFVSHDLSAVRNLTNRCLFLESGTVKFLGPTEGGIETYTRGAGRTGPLRSIEGRGQHTRVLSVTVVNSDADSPTGYHSPDRPLILDVTIETDGTRGLSFEIYILNAMGQRIFFYTSALFDGINLPTAAGHYRFRIAFNPLLMASGDYRIDFATSFVNINYDHYVENAAVLHIPYFNPTGRSWNFRAGENGSVAMRLESPASIEEIGRRRRVLEFDVGFVDQMRSALA